MHIVAHYCVGDLLDGTRFVFFPKGHIKRSMLRKIIKREFPDTRMRDIALTEHHPGYLSLSKKNNPHNVWMLIQSSLPVSTRSL
jgi:hypothetical protein